MAIRNPLNQNQEVIPPDSTAQDAQAFVANLTKLTSQDWINFGGTALRVLLIFVIAWLVVRLIDKAARRWKLSFADLPDLHPRKQRIATVSTLLTSSARYLIWPLAILMVLSEFQLDISALIATAGIAGIALGFGAQTLVQDFISGVFLLFDDTIRVGDLVRINNEEGTVEYIGVRLIKVRKLNGELLMVPAGELRIFGNRSVEFARVMVNISLAYEQDIEEILPVIQKVAEDWAAEHKEILQDDAPTVQAITELADSSVNARIMIKVNPGEQFEAERELRRRLKSVFDEKGIEIPFPRKMVYTKNAD